MPRRKVPLPTLTIERFTLDNGLRVVFGPDRSSPTVAIVVYYDVGFRSEPEGRTGFAHLFEHLMFQGSVNLEKGMLDKLIMGNGGILNGSTRSDYTNYISHLPATALDLGLFIEADRMLGLRLTEESLQNQIDVVKEEIRVNVMNVPYGGFPWIDLPPVMFRTFNNAHDGYGSFVDLEAASLDDALEFFDHYYAPANAVLCVTGDIDGDEARQLVERHFGVIPARAAPSVPDCSEPVIDGERRLEKPDRMAPMPAVAVGYRVPDPIADVERYLATVVLCEVLADGDASRLHQRLVKTDKLATHVGGLVGTFGDPFDVRDPTMLQLLAYHPAATVDQVLTAIDEEVAAVAAGVDRAELERVVTTMASAHLRRLDNLLQRAMVIAPFEQQRGRPELVNELPAALAEVSPDDVAAAARDWLQPNRRAVLSVVPGASA